MTILRYTAVQDAGKAIHPSYVEGQMQGGAVQGIGWALNEEYVYNDQGEMTNASFLDYRMPTCLDLPMIDTVIVEVPNPGHPYGVRGVGEVPIVPPPAALANAIYRATGVRMRELPMSPEVVLGAVQTTGDRGQRRPRGEHLIPGRPVRWNGDSLRRGARKKANSRSLPHRPRRSTLRGSARRSFGASWPAPRRPSWWPDPWWPATTPAGSTPWPPRRTRFSPCFG